MFGLSHTATIYRIRDVNGRFERDPAQPEATAWTCFVFPRGSVVLQNFPREFHEDAHYAGIGELQPGIQEGDVLKVVKENTEEWYNVMAQRVWESGRVTFQSVLLRRSAPLG